MLDTFTVSFSEDFYSTIGSAFKITTSADGCSVSTCSEFQPLEEYKELIEKIFSEFSQKSFAKQPDKFRSVQIRWDRYGTEIFKDNLIKLYQLTHQKTKKRGKFSRDKIFTKVKRSRMSSPFEQIPDEILCHIFSWIPLDNVMTISKVCKDWNRLCHEYSITGKKCEELILSLEGDDDLLSPSQRYLLDNAQTFVHKLDISSMDPGDAQLRLMDTVSEVFTELEEIALPKYPYKELNEIYLNSIRYLGYNQFYRLQNVRQLSVLMLDYCQIDDESFEFLGKMPHLKKLSLYNTSVSKLGFEFLSHTKSLRILMIGYQNLSESKIESISKIKKLRDLCFYNCVFKNYRTFVLSKLTHLHKLVIHDNRSEMKFMSDPELFIKFQKLRHLEVTDYSFHILDTIFPTLLELPKLKYLQFDHNQLSRKKKLQIKKDYQEKYSRKLKISRF
ncbi:MAG: hypothetical protein K940chlam3_01713 [Chlamydiae bacterium]|nr:hypothetical protein [Chlamydiota bacterium]